MKNHYAIYEMVYFGKRAFKKIAGYRDLEGLRAKLLKFSVILKKEDCLDLPPKIYKTMYVDLTSEQRRAYNELIKRAVTYIQDHEITALNALALLTRLLQICCGQLKVGENDYVSIDNNRIETTEDLVNEAPGKVIVWTSYRRTAVDIMDRLKDRAILLPGGLSPEARQERLSKFRDNVQVLVANPASSGHGITLIEADTVIYYSNSHNLEHRIQSEDRTHRIGQTKSVQYIDLVAPGTVEEKVIRILKDKKTLADQVISNKSFEEFITS
jgi:SNF2 family DNA or RNA helicase